MLIAEQDLRMTPSRGAAPLADIDGWQSKLHELANVDRASDTALTDEELDEMLYDEWLIRDTDRVTS